MHISPNTILSYTYLFIIYCLFSFFVSTLFQTYRSKLYSFHFKLPFKTLFNIPLQSQGHVRLNSFIPCTFFYVKTPCGAPSTGETRTIHMFLMTTDPCGSLIPQIPPCFFITDDPANITPSDFMISFSCCVVSEWDSVIAIYCNFIFCANMNVGTMVAVMFYVYNLANL